MEDRLFPLAWLSNHVVCLCGSCVYQGGQSLNCERCVRAPYRQYMSGIRDGS